MRYLTFALAKGRLSELSAKMLDKIGISSQLEKESRKLVYVNDEFKLKFILPKAWDVPTYVEYGAADLGVVGKDTLMEEKRNIYEILDLGFGKCKIAVAGFSHNLHLMQYGNNFRVASKYPVITEDYFHGKRQQNCEVIKMSGSVELAAISGIADMIVDLVETGTTLKENGLTIFTDIADISARLVVNRVSLKMEHTRITELINRIKEAI